MFSILVGLSLAAQAAPPILRPCSVVGTYFDAYPGSTRVYRTGELQVRSFEKCVELARVVRRRMAAEHGRDGAIILKLRFSELDPSFKRLVFERGFIVDATLERVAEGESPESSCGDRGVRECYADAKARFPDGPGSCDGRVLCLEGSLELTRADEPGTRLVARVRKVNLPSLATLLPFLAD